MQRASYRFLVMTLRQTNAEASVAFIRRLKPRSVRFDCVKTGPTALKFTRRPLKVVRFQVAGKIFRRGRTTRNKLLAVAIAVGTSCVGEVESSRIEHQFLARARLLVSDHRSAVSFLLSRYSFARVVCAALYSDSQTISRDDMNDLLAAGQHSYCI